MDIRRLCDKISQYQTGQKKMTRLNKRYDLPPEQYFLLHNIIKACVEYNNYVSFPHKFFVSNRPPTDDVVRNCLCNAEHMTKVGEGWWAEAFVIEDPAYVPTSACAKKPAVSQSGREPFKYLVKVEHLTRHNVTPFGNLKELTKAIEKRYRTLEIAKKAGSIGVGPQVFNGYECIQGKQVYFVTVMKYVQGKTYAEFFKQHKGDRSLIDSVVKQIRSKIEKLNDHRILHKDVHADNIIVVRKGDKYVPVLIDFGNAEYAVDVNLPTIDDPKDLKQQVDDETTDKLVFKLLDDNVIKFEKN
jgi:tRNA A-37 threonylcarbamoyl transferase component Bud32